MEPLAEELNQTIRRHNPYVLDMLSGLGREMFFPRGIIAQTAEARAKASRYNATIGMAMESGRAMFLPCVMEPVSGLSPDEAVRYAPVTGLPELRAAWKEKMLADNPSLKGKAISLPLVTNGLTHGLGIAADLFCEPGDVLLLPDKIWGNYRLIFCLRRGARLETYPFFGDSGGFNLAGFRDALRRACADRAKVVVLLNFPNNPTGYSVTQAEGEGIAQALLAAAQGGTNLVAITDDAYFGLFYEPEVMRESLFSLLADRHERLLAVKGDAATKELFVWGLRVGFLTFSAGGSGDRSDLYQALEKKVAGAIRSSISNCSMLSQRLVLRALRSPEFVRQARARRRLLQERALEVKRVLEDPKYAEAWDPYPFNSGYFMCLRLKRVAAEALRRHLLERYGVGTIATGERDLRIAFSCVEKESVRDLFDTIHAAAGELS